MMWLIGLGGSLGAVLRYWLSDVIKKRHTQSFPASTWVVNVVGSFLLGWLAGLYAADAIGEGLWYLFGIGFCGAFTTFSTFGRETMLLLQANQVKTAAVYVVTSVAVGLMAAGVGLWI
ncbi:fluoride efflux transporter CrcB [Lentibacillus salinarum]|uniref:Fluoride-specific ion channel FluC n=1 Tax=Lentibacillus salinarum TaxID=446820 RepID=A0ABW3ZS70_9BACI